MNPFIRFTTLAALLFGASSVSAEIPAGYYDNCEGKTGEALLKALFSKISSHTNVGYDGLWNVYKTSDVHPDGTLWDIYTDKNWGSSFTKCGNYKNIGDCVNREHSFPKSWFGGKVNPMYSDAFHLYPTDGKVNGQRSSFPYGECSGGTRLASNGSVHALGRLGSSTFSGYSGTVFEPDDQYKGDLARSYFYMAACYNDKISGWNSEMLAGNSYPAYKTWAVNLLLKWARQDEVSQKEIDRNEAIYSYQHNRNPFIDHPELVEYIWGEKKGQPWHPGAVTEEPDILQPVLNTAVDLGVGAVNVAMSQKFTVKTRAIEDGVMLSTYPSTFSVSPSWIVASEANNGVEVTVSYNGPTAGTYVGSLSITADDMEREVELKATVVDGLPIYDATDITSESFVVRWVKIGSETNYTLNVSQGTQSIPGYPKTVNASQQSYTVTGLDPETTYTYRLTSSTLSSEIKTVTTGQLVPSIDVMFDGTLHFEAAPGEPSAVAELLLDIENISDDIVISVESPFEVSTDKSSWSRSVTLDPEEDRFYMRANSPVEGSFTTSIVIKAGTYENDDAEATASIVDPNSVAFIETFEVDDEYAESYTPYKSNTTFTGVAAKWTLSDAGIGNQSQDFAVNGSKVIRFGKNATSSLTMAEDKQGGLGTVVFEASKWGTDADPTIAVEYSTDGGATWTQAASVTITTSDSEVTTSTATINKAGNGRIRFRQTSSKRLFLDNVSITNYSELQAIDEFEYHSWDAFCRDGQLVVECREKAEQIAVYGVDGLTWVNDTLDAGEHIFDLPKGLYIVVSGDFPRRVLVK
ncbi:MAG: endonuclease [Bacteroides sp.]|nr:endonuclease [Bacteroides sp.]MCM1412990.1 endonuclease [Bacteroides sp.]MCM1471696.1 endonuclease [Bacteroides sp.]